MRQNNLWKKATAIILAGTLFFGMTGCSSSSSASESSTTGSTDDNSELVTVNEAVMTNQLDYYIAVIGTEYGIFEDYGINLQYTEYASGINTTDAVVNGTASIGMMANYALVNRFGNVANETDLVIFSELSSKSILNGGLYVAPDYADDLSSLDGSTGFITKTGTVQDYYNSQVIEYLGFDEADQNFVNTDSDTISLAAVQSGEASAWYVTGANASKVEDLGWVLAIPYTELSLTTGSYFVTTKSYQEENTETLAKWLEAEQAAYDYINENLDEAADIMEEKTGITTEDFKLTWESLPCAIGFSEEGLEDLETMQTWCYANGKYDNEFNIRDFIDTSALEIVFPEKVTIETAQ